ncbi:MAG: glycosyltransferase family 4 protein [Deltaproteobacteria bacterium]|nr:glycosyltransferase family 4 protein [Deltaproteobacteria bacterium]
MKIGYFINHIGMSGGVKVVLQHVTLLRGIGYEAVLLTKRCENKLDISEPLIISQRDNLDDVPNCDIYVGTHISDVEYLFKHKRRKVVHLCQGYEPIKYMARVKKEFIREKYLREGIRSNIRQYINILKSKRKIKRVESVYALPTVKAAVSKHLVELIEKKYRQKCHLIQNGIDQRIFYPDEKRVWGENEVVSILSVGAMQVGFKGIQDTLIAIKLLKDKGVNVELTRVSPTPPSRKELDRNIVDRFYEALSEKEMANLYRNTDIFISSSLEVEGFGLPAMEALASGVPSILTEISSYKNFDEKMDFAYFVPTHRPDKIVEGILALIEKKELRDNMIQKGLRVARRYTLEITQAHLLNFIQTFDSR